MKRQKLWMSGIALLVAALLVGLGAQALWAESNLSLTGSATARLNFRITIPTILYLQIGTEGSGNIDRVSCSLSNIPGTGAVDMTSSGTNPIPTRAAFLVPNGQKVKLTVNSSTDMVGDSPATTTKIPFKEITCTAEDFTSYTFTGDAAQPLDTWTGSGNYTGKYKFTYANNNYYDADTYNGQVTYTLSTP